MSNGTSTVLPQNLFPKRKELRYAHRVDRTRFPVTRRHILSSLSRLGVVMRDTNSLTILVGLPDESVIFNGAERASYLLVKQRRDDLINLIGGSEW